MVFIISHDQKRAKPCRTRVFSPKREAGMETIPSTTVYSQMRGSKIKKERRRLSQPYFLSAATGKISSFRVSSVAVSEDTLADSCELRCSCAPADVCTSVI